MVSLSRRAHDLDGAERDERATPRNAVQRPYLPELVTRDGARHARTVLRRPTDYRHRDESSLLYRRYG